MIVSCAVCEIEIEEGGAFASIDHDGEVYYLCSSRCLEEFEQEPERYGPWTFDEQEAADLR